MASFHDDYKIVIKRIFNNWTGLRLAVEHGMGGRNGHKTAMDVMNYMYEFCIGNEGVNSSEILEILEELMDQEFNTILEDGSLAEISKQLYDFLQMFKDGKTSEIQLAINRLPQGKEWLTPNVKMNYIRDEDDSSSSGEESDSDCPMDVDMEAESNKVDNKSVNDGTSGSATATEEGESGWTMVKGRRKK